VLGARRTVLILVLSALVNVSNVKGEGNASAMLSFKDAREIALKQNADLASARARVLAALAEVRRARTWANPIFTASTAHIASDGSGNNAGMGNRFFDRSYDSIFSLSQLIEVGGKRGLRRSSANEGVKSARAQLEDISRQLVESVERAYIAAVEARQEAHTIAETARSLRQEAAIAEHRVNAGDLSRADKAQLEIAAGQRELDAASAEANAASAVITLQILLGEKSPDGRLTLSENLDGVMPKLSALQTVSMAGLRPDLASAEADVRKSELDLSEQKHERVPDVTLGLQYERNPPDLDNTVGLSVSLPLPVFDLNAAGIESARASRDQAAARLEKTRVQAAADLALARVTAAEAYARAQRYEQELGPKSADVLKTIDFSYRRGGNSLLELLAAERDDHDIRIAMLRAQADYAESAVSLLSALNRLTLAGS
jgi:cobalt-zinc-cadmium efflux system outer membrane protein